MLLDTLLHQFDMRRKLLKYSIIKYDILNIHPLSFETLKQFGLQYLLFFNI